MSTTIHGLESLDSPRSSTADIAPSGVLVVRLQEPCSAEAIAALKAQLAEQGVVVTSSSDQESTDVNPAKLTAFSWQVPDSDSVKKQHDVLTAANEIAEAWLFSQRCEADLTDWFAPRWRVPPPSATETSFELGVSPEDVSWEGFGISLTFARPIGEDERKVAAALAGLWLSAYSDRSSESTLGGRCYRRPVIAPRGDNGMVIGLEGFANPGTNEEATGHILWLAEQVATVLPVECAQFVSLLPQPGDEAMAMAPTPSSATTTREWKAADIKADPAIAEAIALNSDADVSNDQPNEEPDDWDVAKTQFVVRGSNNLAEVVAKQTTSAEESEAESRETLPPPSPAATKENQTSSDEASRQQAPSDVPPAPAAVDKSPEPIPAIASALAEVDIDKALAVFATLIDKTNDKSEAANALLEYADSLDPSDWDEIPSILKLAPILIDCNLESPSPQLMWIAALCRIGRGNEAIDIGLAHRKRPMVLFETFERLCVFRRTEEALTFIPELKNHGHEGVGNHYYNLGCRLQANHPQVASVLYRGAIACGSPRPQADINLGLALLAAGDPAAAARVSRTALETSDDPNLWANLIDAQVRIGHRATRSGDTSDEVKEAQEAIEQTLSDAIKVLDKCVENHEAQAPSSCEVGCAPLLTDIVDAMLAADNASEALELINRHTGVDEEMTHSVLTVKARALSALGDASAAGELLDHHVSVADATTASYYRARANHALALGNTDAVIGFAAAAMLADTQCRAQLLRDPIRQSIETLDIDADGHPPRPPQVPEGARWAASDREWEWGDRDQDGKKQGPFRYYRADGSLCNESHLVDDAPEGDFLRFHESGEISQKGCFKKGQLDGTRIWIASTKTTSEQMHGPQISQRIRRSEMDYTLGKVTGVRHYNADGELCAPDGQAYPDRPGEVAANAFFRGETWVAGEVDNDGLRYGTWKTWTDKGILTEESNYSKGELDGEYKAFFPDGSLSAEGQYKAGEATGTFVFQRRGELEHDDFPIAAASIAVAEVNHDTAIPGVRLYDKSGREATIAGTPLEEWTSVHPSLKSWWNDLWQVSWPKIEDASENAHRIPHLLVGLVTSDEAVTQFVFKALSWHLYRDGVIYPATATALPFLIRLCEVIGRENQGESNVPYLCNFIRSIAVLEPSARKEATEASAKEVLEANQALIDHTDVFVKLLGHPCDATRAAAGAIIGGCHSRADDMSSHLSAAVAIESSDMVRASHMFSLASLATPEALFVVEAQVDANSKLVAAASAMAMVMHRGPQSGNRVVSRLVQSLLDYDDSIGEQYSESPWSDDHIVTELSQALDYACGEGTTNDGNDDNDDNGVGRLIAAFPSVNTEKGVAAVAAAIMVAAESGDGLNPDIRRVLTAIADCDSLWNLGSAVTDLLNSYELPTNPDELRELAASPN